MDSYDLYHGGIRDLVLSRLQDPSREEESALCRLCEERAQVEADREHREESYCLEEDIIQEMGENWLKFIGEASEDPEGTYWDTFVDDFYWRDNTGLRREYDLPLGDINLEHLPFYEEFPPKEFDKKLVGPPKPRKERQPRNRIRPDQYLLFGIEELVDPQE